MALQSLSILHCALHACKAEEGCILPDKVALNPKAFMPARGQTCSKGSCGCSSSLRGSTITGTHIRSLHADARRKLQPWLSRMLRQRAVQTAE